MTLPNKDTQPIAIRIFRRDNYLGSIEWTNSQSLVFGRQTSSPESLFEINEGYGDEPRVSFAPNSASTYSRRHMQLNRGQEGAVEVANTSNSPLHVMVGFNRRLNQSESAVQVLPIEITIGDYRISVERSLNSLPRRTIFHKSFEHDERLKDSPKSTNDSAGGLDQLIAEITTANSVLLQANSKDELYRRAIQAVKKILQMDGVAIYDASNFDEEFSLEKVEPSLTALEEIRDSKQVRWTPVEKDIETVESQMGLDCFIGGPIVGPDDEVQAILYAHRNLLSTDLAGDRRPLSPIFAQVLDLVACSVASALERIQNQATRNRFEQFFPPSLARKLIISDHILKPCVREVSVMFCDIRKFSSISQNLDPETVSDWMQDVMTKLSDCVHAHNGVVVDYIGDELMAMWGAPDEISEHATQACDCANQMLAKMEDISNKWRNVINDETKFGIGISSGPAKIGNTGSKARFKYGPLGNTVNCASRVQGLTKFLKVDALVTGETRAALDPRFQLRRLGKAKVVNIQDSLELFQLLPHHGSDVDFKGFETALVELENGKLEQAADVLKSLNFKSPDHPSLLLLNEVVSRVLSNVRSGDFTWDFNGK